jgi:hypothetical protein
MNLWGSDRVFLTLGLVTMFLVFGVFAKKLMRLCSLRWVMVVPFITTKGIIAPSRFEHRHTSSTVAAPAFVLKWYSAPWTSDVVLNLLFLRLPNQKSVTLAFDHLTDRGCPSVP